MSKRKARVRGGKIIVNQKRTHQEAFEELKPQLNLSDDELAGELARIPNKENIEKTKVLNVIFIICLGLIIVLRSIGLLALGMVTNLSWIPLLIAFAIALVVPALGIYGAVKYKPELYRSVGFLFILSIFRSFRNGEFEAITADPYALIGYIPFLGAIGLAFYLPYAFKVSYKSESGVDEEGNRFSKVVFEESESQFNDSELLDD